MKARFMQQHARRSVQPLGAKMIRFALAFTLLLAVDTVTAQPACDRDAGGAFDDIVCAAPALETAERELEANYSQLLALLPAAEAAALRKAQDAWLKAVEADALVAEAREGGGTAGRLAFTNSREKLIRERALETAAAAFQAARNRWTASGMGSYSFTIRIDCVLCGQGENGPVRVSVRSGRVVGATYIGNTRPGYLKWHPFREKERRLRVTVPMLFSQVESRLSPRHEFDRQWVTYDPGNGHPTAIYYPGGFEDDFFNFHITNFQSADRGQSLQHGRGD